MQQSDTTGSVPLSLLSARSSTNDSVPKVPKVPTREHTTSIQSNVGMGLSVLVVDDDPFLRGLLQRLLVRLGCEVEGAENGQVALQKLGMVTEDALPSEAQPLPVSEGIGLEGPLTSTSGANFGADSKRIYDSSFPFFFNVSYSTDRLASCLLGQSNAKDDWARSGKYATQTRTQGFLGWPKWRFQRPGSGEVPAGGCRRVRAED
jgi:hypothetical protein